jgi:hypothetical protein
LAEQTFGDLPPMAHIPRFKRIVKRPRHISAHVDTDPIFDSLLEPDAPDGVISQISRDLGIARQTVGERGADRINATTPDWSRSR